VTGDELWLARARSFAMHAIAQVERARIEFGGGRYSCGPAIRAPRCISPTASPAAERFRSPGSAPIDRDDLDRLLEPFQDLRSRLRNAVGSADAVERLDADEDLARPGGRSDP
jgi:hypothetical protein